MKVKNDQRSKFSNLSNWKEEAWKNQLSRPSRKCRVTQKLRNSLRSVSQNQKPIRSENLYEN